MVNLQSPGVQIVEIDASGIAPSVANNIAVFSGDFVKGPVGVYTLITNTSELVDIYGAPTDSNYNDWYQCATFLSYANSLLVSRAANTNGTKAVVSGLITTGTAAEAATTITVTGSTLGLSAGDYVTFGTGTEFYEIVSIVANTSFTIERGLEVAVAAGATINKYTVTINAVAEAVSTDAIGEAVAHDYEYTNTLVAIGNFDEYENIETSLPFINSDSKFKFIAKNPGSWGNDIEIAIANPADFGATKDAFDGIALDDLFDYFPTGTQVGVIVRLGDTIVETFTVNLDINAKDSNGKSSYIENVINRQSYYVFVKDNINVDDVKSYLDTATLKLVKGSDSAIGNDDIIAGLEVFANPEEIDIDCIIANELYPIAAVNLAGARKDCLAFVGAKYADVVGKKATDAVANIITWRKTGELNVNSMFACAIGNYAYIYDKFNDKYRWVNLAGSAAGLRCQVSYNRASWLRASQLI